MNERIRYVISAEGQTFFAETARVQERLAGMAGGVSNFLGALGLVGGVGGLGFGALAAAVGQSVSALDDLDERSKGLGFTASELSSLEISARAAGVSSDALAAGVGKFATVLDAARNGSREAAETVRLLGIDMAGLKDGSVTTIDALRTAADALAGYSNGFEKTALAREAFGRGGAAFIAYVNEGGAALTKFNGVSEESVQQAAKLAGEVDKLAAAWERLKLEVGGFFARAILPFQENEATRAEARKALEQQIAELERVVAAGGGQGVTIFDQLFGSEERLEKAKNQLAFLRTQLEGLRSAADDVRGSATTRNVPARRDDSTAGARRGEDPAAAFKRYQDELYKSALAAAKAEQAYIDMENAAADAEWDRYARGVKAYNTELDNITQTLDELAGRADEARKITLTLALEDVLRKNPNAYTPEELQRLVKGIAGIKDEIEQADDSAERFAMTFTSSLGRLIEGGMSMRSVFEALAQDIAKLIIQITVLEPLAKSLRNLFGGFDLGTLFGSAAGGLSGASPLAGSAPGTALATSAGQARAAGVTVNYSIGAIGSGVSRADVISAMEQAKRQTIATLLDQSSRGRLALAG